MATTAFLANECAPRLLPVGFMPIRQSHMQLAGDLHPIHLGHLSGMHSDRRIRHLMEVDHLRSPMPELEAWVLGLLGVESAL